MFLVILIKWVSKRFDFVQRLSKIAKIVSKSAKSSPIGVWSEVV